MSRLCGSGFGDGGCRLPWRSPGRPSSVQDAMELLAAASAEYFRGRMMWQLQLMIAGNDVAANFVQEIQTTTEDTYNFMSAVPGRETTVLVLISRQGG